MQKLSAIVSVLLPNANPWEDVRAASFHVGSNMGLSSDASGPRPPPAFLHSAGIGSQEQCCQEMPGKAMLRAGVSCWAGVCGARRHLPEAVPWVWEHSHPPFMTCCSCPLELLSHLLACIGRCGGGWASLHSALLWAPTPSQ